MTPNKFRECCSTESEIFWLGTNGAKLVVKVRLLNKYFKIPKHRNLSFLYAKLRTNARGSFRIAQHLIISSFLEGKPHQIAFYPIAFYEKLCEK